MLNTYISTLAPAPSATISQPRVTCFQDVVPEVLLFYVVTCVDIVYNWNLRFIVEEDGEQDSDNNSDSKNIAKQKKTTTTATTPPPVERRKRKPTTWRHFFYRVLVLCLAGSLYASAVGGLLLYNISIDSEGEQIKIIDVSMGVYCSVFRLQTLETVHSVQAKK